MTTMNSRESEQGKRREGLLYLLKKAVEIAVVLGSAQLGAYLAAGWGDIGRATGVDLGWVLGFFLGILAVYLIESATIGLKWPQAKSPNEKPSWELVVAVSCIAAGAIGGQVLWGRIGAWIGGGLVVAVIFAAALAMNRFKKRTAE